MTPEEELHAAVRQAINDSETAAGNPDDLLTLQATAAVGAVRRLSWFKQAGTEFAVKRGDVTEEVGFNTEAQARAWGVQNLQGPYTVHSRPVGVWEQLP
jgi:hypothetical protein